METGLRRLRYFSAVAQELNFRRAARRLNITQPALSRAIAQLEQEIGFKLLERTNRSVSLTAAGATFADGCNRVLSNLDATVHSALKVAHGGAGSLVVGYTDTAIVGILPDLIRSFLENAPDVHIRLIQVFTAQQRTMLGEGTLDVGILTGPVDDEDFGNIEVQVDRLVALVPKGNRLAARRKVTLPELASETFIQGDPEAWGIYNGLLFAECEKAGFQPDIVQTAPESRAILGLVACGLGVSVMPESLSRGVDERIRALPLAELDSRMRTYAVWPKALRNPAALRFVEHISKVLAGR